jgi:glutaredoxin 3
MFQSLVTRQTQHCVRSVYYNLTPSSQGKVPLSIITLPLGARSRHSHHRLHPTHSQLITRTTSPPGHISRMGLSSSLLSTPAGLAVQEAVHSDCVVIFSKTTCGFCGMAKRVFSQLGVSYTAIELNTRPDGAQMQDVLVEMTGQTTVRPCREVVRC